MELIQTLTELFFETVTSVVTDFPYMCMFLVAAFLCALLFNILHALLGGD